jgi:hypothetical protein
VYLRTPKLLKYWQVVVWVLVEEPVRVQAGEWAEEPVRVQAGEWAEVQVRVQAREWAEVQVAVQVVGGNSFSLNP